MNSGEHPTDDPVRVSPTDQPAPESPSDQTAQETAADPPIPESAPTQDAPTQESVPAGPENSAATGSGGSGGAKKKKKAPLPRLGRGPLAARGLGVAKPASPGPAPSGASPKRPDKGSAKSGGGKPAGGNAPAGPRPGGAPGSPAFSSTDQGEPAAGGQEREERPPRKPKPGQRPRSSDEKQGQAAAEATQHAKRAKVSVPSIRAGLSDDLQAELEATLADSDVESILGGGAGLPDRREPLAEGARVHARILKMHGDSVFIALGGPDEGVVPSEQFTDEEPAAGTQIEVLVRGFNREDGLYVCTLPGQAMEVNDWEDIQEGSVVEATVTGHNTGGLECTVGAIRAFMPISQVTEYRVEDLSEFVGQKMVCLVNEANERRGNLVLSRRAILEREREEKRREQLEKMEAGDVLEGTVRSVRDFGAFVDLGGLDGLIHVSKLSWERIKHPNEVIEEGQRVKVKVDRIDKQTGKIGLSYRDLLENPWDAAEAQFSVGSVHTGEVTRIAAFGCFVRLTPGVEGLVHISELANHRVSKVSAFVNEGDQVEVKVLNFDRDAQKIALSMKAAQATPADQSSTPAEDPDEPPRDMAVKQHVGPLKGGNDRDTGGERFGLRW